jgi:cob(I)alamin adenosyltransferase
MVQLTKIYTRGGDKGQTSLGNGQRVAKHDVRVAAYGTIDELNAVLGIAQVYIQQQPKMAQHGESLARIQNDLFDLGADLCRPQGEDEKHALRIIESQVERLEQEIDAMNADLAPLKSFVLPGGTPAAAHLHMARTVARRAERLITALSAQEEINAAALRYTNRLSDYFFVLARVCNNNGADDVLWVPGATR